MFGNCFAKIAPFMRYCGKILESRAGQVTIWRMRIASWVTNATNTNSKYLVLIAFEL